MPSPQTLATGLVVQLLGRPRLAVDGASGYRYRSRKSWAVLAFLLLSERPPTRSRLASLLFAEADDPLRALRWASPRSAAGSARTRRSTATPCVSRCPPARRSTSTSWCTATGGTPSSCPASARTSSTASRCPTPRRSSRGCSPSGAGSAAAAESILHEAALGHLAAGELDRRPRPRAPRRGDEPAGREPPGAADPAVPPRRRRRRRPSSSTPPGRRPPERELGESPGAAVRLALRERREARRPSTARRSRRSPRPGRPPCPPARSTPASRRSRPRSGSPTEAGDGDLRVETRLALAEALIHTLRRPGRGGRRHAARGRADRGGRR